MLNLLLGAALLLTGLAVFVVGKVPAAVLAYKKERIVWGTALVLVAPLFPPLGLLYCMLYWEENRLFFWIMLPGMCLMIAGGILFFREVQAQGLQVFPFRS